PKETQTRLTLLRAGFAEPEINLPVRAPRSGERFRIDLAYPSLRIAVEYDGFWHSTDKKRHGADRRKDDVLHEMGWRVVRASDETHTRLTLLRAGFAEPEINLPVRAPRSGERFRIDLAYPSLRIAVEYDGFWHSTDKKRHGADRRKDDVLHEMGWRVVRASD